MRYVCGKYTRNILIFTQPKKMVPKESKPIATRLV